MFNQGASRQGHIPDSTPLAEDFFLFDEREWYLMLRENYVSGLITYWEFNRHEFRVQLYTIVSLIEGISRDILAKDGCGVADTAGINLDPGTLTVPLKRFEVAKKNAGGNRFVDELDFHEVHEALKRHDRPSGAEEEQQDCGLQCKFSPECFHTFPPLSLAGLR